MKMMDSQEGYSIHKNTGLYESWPLYKALNISVFCLVQTTFLYSHISLDA